MPLHLDVEVWPVTDQSDADNLQEHGGWQVVYLILDITHKQFEHLSLDSIAKAAGA